MGSVILTVILKIRLVSIYVVCVESVTSVRLVLCVCFLLLYFIAAGRVIIQVTSDSSVFK